ncbi:unnamed protein product [Meganyctiphanes norvegica]|uniref:Protein HTATIP2 n=1 Tax=Meganyctiphanes norvegica TaxID=48144 RepID=A0AAV2R309_MEGNR
MSDGITALVLGGSGEIGKLLVKELNRNLNFSRIILITRRNLNMSSNRIEERLVDFEKLDEYKEAFQGAEVAYSCLGTTRAKAGPQGFVRVDRDYIAHAAQILKDIGCCRHFHLVSSQGAKKDSNFLYLKTKGEIEELVSNMGLPRISIYRPSVLLCDREETRPLEKFSQVILRGFDWRNKWSIETETVARAMVCNTLEEQLPEKAGSSVEILDNMDILRLGID